MVAGGATAFFLFGWALFLFYLIVSGPIDHPVQTLIELIFLVIYMFGSFFSTMAGIFLGTVVAIGIARRLDPTGA